MTVATPVPGDHLLADLRAAALGTVLVPRDDGYDTATTVWNAIIRHPVGHRYRDDAMWSCSEG
jgi:hypothetical protein